MNVFDWIVIGISIIALISGLRKGAIKQALGIVGIFVVAIGARYLSPLMQEWLIDLLDSAQLASAISFIASMAVIGIVYGILGGIITKLVNNIPFVGKLNRILGAVIAVAGVYFGVSLIISVLQVIGSSGEKPMTFITESWVVNNIYKNNFFGDWVMEELMKGLDKLTPNIPPIASLVG